MFFVSLLPDHLYMTFNCYHSGPRTTFIFSTRDAVPRAFDAPDSYRFSLRHAHSMTELLLHQCFLALPPTLTSDVAQSDPIVGHLATRIAASESDSTRLSHQVRLFCSTQASPVTSVVVSMSSPITADESDSAIKIRLATRATSSSSPGAERERHISVGARAPTLPVLSGVQKLDSADGLVSVDWQAGRADFLQEYAEYLLFKKISTFAGLATHMMSEVLL